MEEIQRRLVLDNLMAHYGPQHWWDGTNKLADWMTMILIQRTSSKNVAQAMANLRPILTVPQLQAVSLAELETRIHAAGFFREKAARIKALIDWYVEEGASFDQIGRRPVTELRQTLLSLKGIGPETADVMLLYIFDQKVFVPDTYAMRLFNRLGDGPYKQYDQMRAVFAPVIESATLQQCKEWHALIDEHGKVMRKPNATPDDWLLLPATPTSSDHQ